MHIKWYGHAAFGITPKSGPTIITDPYNPNIVGYSTIKDTADLVLMSSDDDQGHCRGDLINGNPEIVNTLAVAQSGGKGKFGKGKFQGIDVEAIATTEAIDHPDRDTIGCNAMYRWEVDGIKMAHMGDVGHALSSDQEQFFDNLDILFALTGAHLTIDLPDLMRMIMRCQPKLVIPMHFRTLTYKPRDSLWIESFLKYFDEDTIDFALSNESQVSQESLPKKTRILVMDYTR